MNEHNNSIKIKMDKVLLDDIDSKLVKIMSKIVIDANEVSGVLSESILNEDNLKTIDIHSTKIDDRTVTVLINRMSKLHNKHINLYITSPGNIELKNLTLKLNKKFNNLITNSFNIHITTDFTIEEQIYNEIEKDRETNYSYEPRLDVYSTQIICDRLRNKSAYIHRGSPVYINDIFDKLIEAYSTTELQEDESKQFMDKIIDVNKLLINSEREHIMLKSKCEQVTDSLFTEILKK